MKFFHLSDLHLGKRVNEFSMIDDQEHILKNIISLAKEHKPDAVLISGDIYDKSTPVVEAMQLFDQFLVCLNKLNIAIFIIYGNHDSALRISFGAELFKKSNIHIAPSYDGVIKPITVTDDFGEVDIWLLPYLKPSIVRKYFPEKNILTYNDAIFETLNSFKIDLNKRNVLLAHQFVTGATLSDSEEILIGGLENVDGKLFDNFDYVALGHLHKPQKVGRETMRYCGSPLKYSFSEANHKKSVTFVNMEHKGNINISKLPLIPIRDLRQIKGSYKDIMSYDNYANTNTNDYVKIILTDEQEEPDALSKVRTVYPNLMRLEYDNKRTNSSFSFETATDTDEKTPIQLFSELFEKQNGQPMVDEQIEYVENILNQLWTKVTNLWNQ